VTCLRLNSRMHAGPIRLGDPPVAALAAAAGVERRLQRLVVHAFRQRPGQARDLSALQRLRHGRARNAEPAGDLVRRYRRRLQPNNLARIAHAHPLRWHRLLPWSCQSGDLITPTAAPANADMTTGGIIPLQGGAIIQESGAASHGISNTAIGAV
jgi:hypothetical protein